MKVGLATSAILHATLIGFGLLTFSAPHALEVADVESFPVDIVPVESITQIQQGDKKAVMKEKATPLPTRKPDVVLDAKKVGEAAVDIDKPPAPVDKPKPVEAAAAPAPAPEPKARPADDARKDPPKQVEPKPADAPATEVTPDPQPKQEVKPDPVAETIVAETPEAETIKLPDLAPVPESKPKPPEARTAKAPDRKETDKPQEKQASKPKSDETDFNEDKIAALLTKEKPTGGGAKRSTEEATLGGDKTSSGTKLTQSEMDALRGQVERCWNVPAGALEAESLQVSIKFKLDRAGQLEGAAEILSGGDGSTIARAAAESARRAVIQCAPYNLPADKYEAWADVIVHFDPHEMF
jgi:outer membrane biosynthesis protein TonB